jgi:tetratricopeptide (TPR) repeat protein
MQYLRSQIYRFLPVFALFVFASCLFAQAGKDNAYQAKRQQAEELFSQGKRLEALPLLEDLLQANPRDEEVQVALAASLIDHAATLTDQQAAARERLRARDLLERSGSTSTLAQNLLQLLREMPDSGAIRFSDNPVAEQAMRAGEAAFSQRNFDEAIKNYLKALELDPKNYSAALFIGNAYDKKNDFAAAAKWYERATQLNPDIETAYRYYADMLAREDKMSLARTMLIHAAVAEPYNRIVWRELKAWAILNNTEINLVYVGVPVPKSDDRQAVNANGGRQKSGAAFDPWQAYHAVQAGWRQGSRFKERFPREAVYRHSLAEESEALTAVVKAAESFAGDKPVSELAVNDQALLLLIKLHQAGLLEAYVLFSLGDDGIAKDYSAYRAEHRDKLEEYMNQFVVPACCGNHAARGNAQR